MKFRSDPAKNFGGSFAAMFTPFTEQGSVDHDSLRAMVEWQIASGSHGVTIGGSTGEPGAQSVEERAEAIRTVAAATADRVPFLAGTGTAQLPETLELTQVAVDAGADASMIITPYYARPTQEALYQWYATIAREFPQMPFIIYNVPSRTAVDIAPETVGRLFKDFENIVGIKETTKDFEHFSRVLHLAGKDLLVWSGLELLCLPLMALGGVGFISALANIAPKASAEMYNAWIEGDLETAQRIHYGVHPLVDLLFAETNPAPAKWLMAQRGLIASDYVRPPLIRPTENGLKTINSLLLAGKDYLTPVPGNHENSQEA
ncbi:4-hydroxy-tetrahydrodipicolinate synthase [Psychromicrobium lacuslunae]|uniref:4-hydroxy-tetrahydrodipicolinate synthase n=1 Tax=Psychromicrobium lacuslunae TaxID=1618207 RepID=A0A0D4BYV5_9MICC|nr:4-hydroxy-tetrahydrodipicolinate synthase [Psychromicrobium lacuslunae]AJT41296.1 dihydrodipicolinate synthase [Psychromicrobium lacuslunae]